MSLAVHMLPDFSKGDELERKLTRLYISARSVRYVFDLEHRTFGKTGDFTTYGIGVRAEYESTSQVFSIKVLGYGCVPPLCLSRVWETERASDLTWATSLDCTRIRLAWDENVCEDILEFTEWVDLARRATLATAARCGAPIKFIESWGDKQVSDKNSHQ